MYTQSYEDAGRDLAASASAETLPQVAAWRPVPPQVSGTPAASLEANPIYEENLQTVLEDSERHLDALWNMLNSQMNRLSNGYAPTTEAQAMSLPSLAEQTNHTASVAPLAVDEIAPMPQYQMVTAETEESPVEQPEPVASASVTMPFNFMPTTIPPLNLPEEYTSEEVSSEEPTSVPEPDAETEPEPVAALPDVMETVEASEIVEPVSAAEEVETPTLPEETAFVETIAPIETPAAFTVPREAPRAVSGMLPPVRINSTFRENWLVVTACEAGRARVLPTVTMKMQSQPNQSLQMRSTAMGEMPTGETPLVIMESREEAGSEPSALRVEIAYTSDAPDVVFEVSSQVEDDVQISMADKGGDLCASWEVSKQKGSYARAKATISRQPGDPEVVIEIQRFRDSADVDVWCSLLSFSVLSR